MPFMHWSDHYLTGIDLVDRQHRKLVDMINDIAPKLASGFIGDKAFISDLLDALFDYVKVHFSTEDGIMKDCGIDPRHLEHHRQSHREFADQVAALRIRFEQGQDLNGEALLRFLSNWLAFHILGEDQRMARELNAIENGIAANMAYDQIEGNKAEILQGANDVLVNALVNLFTQLTEQNKLLSAQNQKLQAAHDQLDDYRKNLERQVDLRTTELRHAKELAEAASTAKSRFLATISHELLTPLNAILGFAHLLEHSDIPQKQKQQAKHIGQSGEQLSALIEQILQFAHLNTKDIQLQTYPFQIASLLKQVYEEIHKAARDKGLTVKIAAIPSLPPLQGDVRILRDALGILANNAVKFTDIGEITLSAALVERNEHRVKICLAVQDTGIGISNQQQTHLFQAFNQLDATNTRRHSGIGLGLAICSELVTLMNGELTLESEIGVGTCFKIQLWLDIDEELTTAHSPNACPLGEALTEFKTLLSEGDISAREAFANLYLILHRLDAEATAVLAEQINSYEFDCALVTLNRITEKSQ